jgi:hypothetical protein
VPARHTLTRSGADLVHRDFSATRVDEKWRGDLNQIPTDEGKL